MLDHGLLDSGRWKSGGEKKVVRLDWNEFRPFRPFRFDSRAVCG